MTPEQIKEFRLSKGWTQTELANRLMTTQGRVGDWERGKHKMTRPFIELFNQLRNKN